MSHNLFTFFRTRFPEDLGKTFLVDPDRLSLSYEDMTRETGRLANHYASLGVKAGGRVAVQAEKSVEGLLVYLAALRVGAVFLPLNPAYTMAEVRYFLEDADPTLLICRPQDEKAMRDLGCPTQVATLGERGEGTLLAGAAAQRADFDDVERAPNDIAAILYTSGTTGRSKGAMLTHENLRSNAETLRTFWRFGPDDRLLHALPIFHTHGLFVATNVTLVSGASIIFLPRFDVRRLIDFLPKATVLMGVPTFYSRLLAEPDFDRALVSHMRLFVSGSAPLSAETHREFASRTGQAILERYGMTETNMNSSNPYDGDRVPGSVGFPLPGVELRIADPETGIVTPNQIGIIEVRGPNVFPGYWRMPDKTAAEFRPDGFFITGDLGYVDNRGYVYIVGRAKDLIICGGFNVYPAEVENAVDALPGVSECAVIGVPHSDMGEAVVAVVRRSEGSSITEEEVIASLADVLARFKQPRSVVFVPELPRNGMGKIQKNELRGAYSTLFSADHTGGRPDKLI